MRSEGCNKKLDDEELESYQWHLQKQDYVNFTDDDEEGEEENEEQEEQPPPS